MERGSVPGSVGINIYASVEQIDPNSELLQYTATEREYGDRGPDHQSHTSIRR